MKMRLLSRARLFATLDGSLPGSSIHRIFQARVLEWVLQDNSKCYLINPSEEKLITAKWYKR